MKHSWGAVAPHTRVATPGEHTAKRRSAVAVSARCRPPSQEEVRCEQVGRGWKGLSVTCYDRSMARPFIIKVDPPPPLTVDEAAAKYGVSRTKSRLLQAFAVGSVSAGEGHSRLKLNVGRTVGARKGSTIAASRGRAGRAASAGSFGIRRKSAKSSRITAAKKK